ncbi:SDR family NAD(P)-dependent oxidoreductase [Brachybacterium sp. GCM10030267]|uniref:SDR family NAD(P)-dependent oxidoreductase n=1 Tax=unclassified Brachybacterium TaxID=2623841 RepID=UPI0036205EF3
MHIDLSGRTALVTASSGGIGLAIADGLARAGAQVVVNGRTPDSLERAVARIQEHGGPGSARGVVADAATSDGAQELAESAGEVDILVNNLGIFESMDALEIDDEQWRRYFEVNVLSAIRLTRMLLPAMMDRGWGRVLSIASDSSLAIPAEMIHYGTSKTALLGASRGFAKTAAGSGVTVNAVMAGPTHTEGVEEFARSLVGDELPWDEAQRRFMREYRPQSLIQRLIEPEEIANMVVYLASPLASATTGGTVRVDGGYVDAIIP